jgi:hypothetical protein
MSVFFEEITAHLTADAGKTLLRRIFGNEIRITSPLNDEVLQHDPQPHGSNVSYEVRGKLRRGPRGHEIWLLVENRTTGEVWPHGFFAVKHEPTGDWHGRVHGPRGQKVRVIAVVAPPTSHDFFTYSEKVIRKTGGHVVSLDHIPAECRNRASVQTSFPAGS